MLSTLYHLPAKQKHRHRKFSRHIAPFKRWAIEASKALECSLLAINFHVMRSLIPPLRSGLRGSIVSPPRALLPLPASQCHSYTASTQFNALRYYSKESIAFHIVQLRPQSALKPFRGSLHRAVSLGIAGPQENNVTHSPHHENRTQPSNQIIRPRNRI